MTITVNIGQLPVVLVWNYFFFTLLAGRCPGHIITNLDDEQARLSMFFENTKIRIGDTITAAQVIVQNFLDGDGYFDASLVSKAVSLLVSGLFLFLVKLFFVWRRVNYIMIVLFYYCLQMFKHVFIVRGRRS